MKKREGREERKKKEKRREKSKSIFQPPDWLAQETKQNIFWEKYDIFSLKAKGKGKKGEEGSNYEKGGKRGNLFFMLVLVHIELTVNLSYDYEV